MVWFNDDACDEARELMSSDAIAGECAMQKRETDVRDIHGRTICEGDTVRIASHYDDGSECDEAGEQHTVVWDWFEDCCVQGNTWLLSGRDDWQPTIYAWPLEVVAEG